MTPNLIIGIGIIAAIAAGLACWGLHISAKKNNWRYVPRYASGVFACLVAFAFPLFAALAVVDAVVLYGVAWMIFGVAGIATWLSHDNDPDPPSGITPDAARLFDAIDKELRK